MVTRVSSSVCNIDNSQSVCAGPVKVPRLSIASLAGEVSAVRFPPSPLLATTRRIKSYRCPPTFDRTPRSILAWLLALYVRMGFTSSPPCTRPSRSTSRLTVEACTVAAQTRITPQQHASSRVYPPMLANTAWRMVERCLELFYLRAEVHIHIDKRAAGARRPGRRVCKCGRRTDRTGARTRSAGFPPPERLRRGGGDRLRCTAVSAGRRGGSGSAAWRAGLSPTRYSIRWLASLHSRQPAFQQRKPIGIGTACRLRVCVDPEGSLSYNQTC